MPSRVSLSKEYARAQAAAGGALASGGFLRIYDGRQPSSIDEPITTQKLLAELRFGSPAGIAFAEEFVFASITPEDSAPDAGKAAWYRAFKSDGESPLRDGSVGEPGSRSDIEMDTEIPIGAEVRVDSLIWRVPR